MILYRTPGRSFTRPPRTSTIECSCRLWPTPGMYAVTSMPLVSRTRATLRSAEFGYLGVVVYTRVHTPRRWGLPLSAGVLVLSTLSSRPLRTNCWIVGNASPCSLALFSECYVSSTGRTTGAGSWPPPALGRVAYRPQDRAQPDVCGEVQRSGTDRPARGGPEPPWRAERPGEPQARRTRLPGRRAERQNGRSADTPLRAAIVRDGARGAQNRPSGRPPTPACVRARWSATRAAGEKDQPPRLHSPVVATEVELLE